MPKTSFPTRQWIINFHHYSIMWLLHITEKGTGEGKTEELYSQLYVHTLLRKYRGDLRTLSIQNAAAQLPSNHTINHEGKWKNQESE